jgi:AraC family transcriptional regulator
MFFAHQQPQTATRLWFYQEREICLHHFRYPAGRLDCLPHTHDEYNIIFCLSGGFEFWVRNARETLEPGDVLVVNPGEVHYGNYGQGSSESRGLTLHLTERAMKEIMQRMRLPVDADRRSVSFFGKVNDPSLLALGEELLEELDGQQSGYEMVAQALVVELIVHLLRHCVWPTVQAPMRILPRQLPSWQMVRALEYMNANGKSSFSLVKLCSHVGTSLTRFIHLFENSAPNGMSPHAFHSQLIVHKAKRLLRQPGFSVKEISYELGFQNDSHFCKVFRNCTGMTPGTYRVSELRTAGDPSQAQSF